MTVEGSPYPDRRDLISVQKAADLVDVDPKTIKNWMKRGDLQGFRLNGHMWRVNRKELLALARPVARSNESGGAA